MSEFQFTNESSSTKKTTDVAPPKQPAPKVGAPIPATAVPTVNQLVHGGGPVVVDDAKSGTLVEMSKQWIGGIFNELRTAQAAAIKALAEPSPPADPGYAVAILSAIAESVGQLALGGLARGVVGLLKAKAGDAAAAAAGTVLNDLANRGGRGAGQAVENRASGEHSGKARAGSAEKMLEVYAEKQLFHLNLVETEAKIRLLLVQDAIAQVKRGDVLALTDALSTYASDDRYVATHKQHVTIGWLRYCTDMAIKQTPKELYPDRPRSLAAFVDGSIGFLDISVKVPEMAYGTAGLKLESAHVVGAGPGLAPMLRSAGPLASLPVYRRIYLRNPGSRLNDEWAFAITPEGKIEINPGCRVLGAIGRASPTTIDDDFFGFQQPNPRYAALGAELVRTWLAMYTSEVIH